MVQAVQKQRVFAFDELRGVMIFEYAGLPYLL